MSQRGFTLIETTIVVAILAMMVAVSIPALNNISRADLRSSSSKVAGFIRRIYDEAALSGQIQRMSFDFESRTLKVEASEELLALEPDSNVLAESAKAKEDLNPLLEVPEELMGLLASDDEDGDDSGGETSPVAALFGVGNLGGSSTTAAEGGAFSETSGSLTLSESVRLMDVWIQGMDEPQAEGIAYLYFFPHGYTQDALIHLEDEDGRVFTVEVAALTGRTSISGEYVEVPK